MVTETYRSEDTGFLFTALDQPAAMVKKGNLTVVSRELIFDKTQRTADDHNRSQHMPK